MAIACARHGCYALNALVDIYLGEQHKNVDFALIKSIGKTRVHRSQGILIIYDIACQYCVHLIERIGDHLPAGIAIDAGIGLFHVHAHKDQCFFRYATSFIPGAGIVAGEILESLWSSLNAISPIARTATLAHRAEMLDDHATDSNHKKMLGIHLSLSKKYAEAISMLEVAGKYYAELSATATPMARNLWTDEIELAEASRMDNISAMDIYAARLSSQTQQPSSPPCTAEAPAEKWITFALMVEEKQ